MKYKIGIIISCYNEQKNVKIIYERLIDSLKNSKKAKDYKIYFIEDNSKDNTKKNIKKLMKKDNKIELISFIKRTGKSIGLQVGFNRIDKNIDLVFMMDADLQDDPKEIDKFIEKIEEGYDLVSGYKKNRKDNLEKRLPSKIYNKVLNIFFNMNLHDHNCGFKCFKRNVINDIKIYDNLHRFLTVFIKYKGYKVGEIEVNHHKRIYGKSKYGITRYFIAFKDLIKVKYIVSHQKKHMFLLDFFIIVFLAIGFKLLFNNILMSIILLIIYLLLLMSYIKYTNFDIKEYEKYYS